MNNRKFMPALIENVGKTIMQSLTDFGEEHGLCNENLTASKVLESLTIGLRDASSECCRSALIEFIEG